MTKVQAAGGLKGARLRVTGLDVMRGGRRVISGLSFELAGGNALVLTGPNGAGKTTLIRALAGLLPTDRGSVALQHAAGAGAEPAIAMERAGEHCHYIGHVNAAKTNLTVYENLSFWARFLGGSGADAWAAIDALDLDALSDIPVGYLSAGQQRRVAIARLLVVERPVWLLDEPTVSLDAANSARLVSLGNAHLACGGMIIAATHLPLAFEPAAELRLQPSDGVLGEADEFAGAGA